MARTAVDLALVDLSVVGPMARTAADLALALDVVAGPDEEREGIGYRLALRPARHDDLKSFRVLLIDTHPLMPAAAAVRTALQEGHEYVGQNVFHAHAPCVRPHLLEYIHHARSGQSLHDWRSR
jgi:amidase